MSGEPWSPVEPRTAGPVAGGFKLPPASVPKGVIHRTARMLAKRLKYRNWSGFCPICEKKVRFYALGDWYRDQLVCGSCFSIPRQRATMRVIQTLYPNWRDLKIHESSPSSGQLSPKLAAACPGYLASQYLPSVPFGSVADGVRSEDIEAQTFADESFDLVVTQDVFEHLFHPDRAIAEIARTLRPGGAHIMSVPIVNKDKASRRRASLVDGEVVHHAEPEYHDNPVDPKGALVTVDWGYDIADFLHRHSGLPTSIFTIDDLSQGIRAEYIEIVVSRKGRVPEI
jgi:SAM-dependent methyltransferase